MAKVIQFYEAKKPPVVAETLSGQRSESVGWMRHSLGADAPHCHEVHMPPGFKIPIHAHLEDEIIYVTAGQLTLGQRTLGVGCSVYVPGNTLYSFVAGSEGCSFINFRPRGDDTQFDVKEFKTLQALQGSERETFIERNAAAARLRHGID
jgi:quercetin dioxygenase-like cupin family protein